MATADVRINIQGDASSFTSAVKSANTALDKTTDKADALGAALSKGADKFDDMGRGAVKMRGALSSLSPEAAGVAGAIDDAADAVEGFGIATGLSTATLGAAAVALGVAFMAYKVLTEEQDRSAAVTASVNQANMELESVYKTERDAVLALKIATGQLTDEQGALVAMQQTAMEAFRENTKATRAQITSLREEQLSMTTAVVDGLQEWGAKWGYVGAIQTAALDALTTDSEELQQEIDALTGVVDKATASTVNTVKAQREAVKATKDRTKAVKEQKEALQEENDLATKNTKIYHDALGKIDAMSFSLKKNKTDVENLSDAYHANLEAIKAAETEALAVVTGNADAEYTARHAALLKSAEAYDAFYRDVDALREASEAKAEEAALAGAKLREDMADKEAAERAKEFQRQLEEFTDVSAAIEAIGQGGVGGVFADVGAQITSAAGEARKLSQELAAGDVSAADFADKIDDLGRAVATSLVQTVGDGLGSVFQARFDDLAKLATDAAAIAATASSEVIRFQEEIEASQLAQQEAAGLTGKALLRAYELGVVGVDDLSDAQESQIEKALKGEEAAAEKKQKAANKAANNAFLATQASAGSQAAILTLLAVSQALASVPPPFNIPVAGLALAAGIAQEAAILSAEPPSFRRGGTALPDERRVVAQVEDGEALQVTSRQGVAKAASDAHNAGMSAPGARGDVRLVLNGRDIGRMIEAGVESARGRQAVTTSAARGRAPRRAA